MEKESCGATNLLDERLLRSNQRDSLRTVSLNFKVPLRVRQQFKLLAASSNMTMTELLLRLLEQLEGGSGVKK